MKLNTNIRKKFRVSNKVKKVAPKDRFRLCISRSSKNISAQIIADIKKMTLLSASSIEKDIIGEKGKLLTENLEVTVSFYNEAPISVDLPNQVNCKIESTDVALKGQTVSSSYKPAILNNGLNIQVPPFIEAGDEVIVDTRNLEYIKKIYNLLKSKVINDCLFNLMPSFGRPR